MDKFDEISRGQGWSDESELAILRNFIQSQGLSESLAAYAQKIANEENEGWE